jgi:proteasome lid subunit RPN8/RPN11
LTQLTIGISQHVLDAMIAHARDAVPDECCGLLIGGESSIDEAVRVRNLESGATRYRIDPAEHVALNRRLRGTGRAVVGAYHSHPRSSANPSPSDLAEAFYPDFYYLIVSLAQSQRPECRAWRVREGAAVELRLRVT